MKTKNTRLWNGELQTWIRYNARSILGLDHNLYYETWFDTAKLPALKLRGIGFTLVDRPSF